jgi:hypothetical protein
MMEDYNFKEDMTVKELIDFCEGSRDIMYGSLGRVVCRQYQNPCWDNEKIITKYIKDIMLYTDVIEKASKVATDITWIEYQCEEL